MYIARKMVARQVQKSPPEILARQAVARALRRGDLVRQPCEVCSSPSTHAHHDDYAKQLDVRWLCRDHHERHHRNAPRINPTRVRDARLNLGYAQRDLAAALGCSTRTVQQWEAELGTHRPHPKHLRKLAELVGVSVGWFLEEEVAA